MNFAKRLTVVYIMLMGCVTAVAQDKTPDFTTLDPVIKSLRSSNDLTLNLRVNDKSFVVLQQKKSSVSAEEAKKAIESNPKGATWLQYGDTGYAICYEVNADIVIETPTKTSLQVYRKVVWEPLATYDIQNWTAFADYLIANGLYSFQDFTSGDSHRYVLSFSPLTPVSINESSRPLALSDEFGRHLRLSPRYPSTAGSNGFVILFHDPHSNALGTSESLAGLRALIDANKNRTFEFLVEGSYEGHSREIGLATLPQVLELTAKGRTRTRMIQSLLHNFLIDTPTAYRLLYGPEIKAMAIDDNNLLTYKMPSALRPPREQFKSLQRFADVVNSLNLSEPAKNSLSRSIGLTRAFVTGDVASVTDETLVDYFKTLAEMFDRLAGSSTILGSKITPAVQAELEAFGRDSRAYAERAEIYQTALERNEEMLKHIVAASNRSSQSIPIAFIGSFHTKGITTVLRQKKIGYAVVEPRSRTSASKFDRERFDRAVHNDTSAAYLTSVRLRKLRVSPRVTEVRTVYRPKMVAKGAALKLELKAAENQNTAIPATKLDINEFIAATGDSGDLANAKLILGDGKQPPPPPEFVGAFVYFDPGSNKGPGGRPTFNVSDVRDDRWSSPERYGFLRSVVFPKRSDPGGPQLASEMTFYRDLTRDWFFYTILDSKSGRIYCFEERAQGNRGTSLVPVPIPSKTGFTDIRIQIVELIKRKENARG